MSDYLGSLATRSIQQSQGIRFLEGELHPRLASQFEPSFLGGATLVEEVIEQESIAPEMPSAPPLSFLYPSDGEGRPTTANQSMPPIDSTAGDGSDPPAVETPSPLARAIEGMRPVSAEQDRAVRQTRRDHEDNETVPSKGDSSLLLSPQSQSVSVAMPRSQADTRPQEIVIGHVSDRVRPFRAEQQGASERSDVVPGALDQPAEPQQVDRANKMQRPLQEQTDSSLSQRPAVTNEVAQVQSTVANHSVSSHMPTPDQNRGVLQSVLARLGEPRHGAEPNAAPTVNVTIDRIEVRATRPPPTSTPKPRSTPVMTLEEYLQRRTTGGG